MSPNQPKTPARAIRIDDQLWGKLQEIASKQRLPVSVLVRDVLHGYVKGQK